MQGHFYNGKTIQNHNCDRCWPISAIPSFLNDTGIWPASKV